MTPVRVGIVGARRPRSGLGPFVARDLEAAGARVVAFAGTSEASVADAARGLAALGIEARGHVGLARLLESERLDALAILSPHATHLPCLEAALAARLHVLCEKPFVWGVAWPSRRAGEIVEAFAAQGLVLHENCQWPRALPAFEALHPGAFASEPVRFAMRMSPGDRGADMLVDALPHPISVLQALAGPGEGRVCDIRFPMRSPDGLLVTLEFAFATQTRRIACRVELVGGSPPPREVWLEIDGRRARRVVHTAGGAWAFSLADGERRVPLPDPMAPLVRDFVDAVARTRAGERPPRATAIAARMEALERLVAAYGAEGAW